MFDLLWMAIFGLVIGVIAKLIMPGKDPGGIIVTALIGMAGSLVGAYIGRSLLGINPTGIMRWIMSIVGAILLLALYRFISSRRS